MDLSSSSGTPTAKEHLCFAEMQSLDADRGLDTVAQAEGCIQLADMAFRKTQFDLAFALARAGVHKHGKSNDTLCKRYLFNLETIVKRKAAANKKIEGPPHMLYLQELLASMPQIFKELVLDVAGPEAMLAGDKCVMMQKRGVMVVGLSLQEWRVLIDKSSGLLSDWPFCGLSAGKMQLLSGVEEAVMRGLSQSEGTSDSQTDLKASWNSWALKLCEVGGGSPDLRSKCLLQRTVLLLQQQMHHKALESATEVLKLCPDSKHASALLATSQHKAGKKKAAAATVSELVVAFMRPEDTNMLSDELGHPLKLTIALLVEIHRTKDALKLLACLLSRVHDFSNSVEHRTLFFGLARLYAKHGLNKDALVSKLPSLCNMPPDLRTWELLKSMAEYTPTAVELQLQKYIDEIGPGHFTHVPQITEVMNKLPFGAHGSGKALHLLKQCAAQVTPDHPDDLRIIVDDLRAFTSSNQPASVLQLFPQTIETLLIDYIKAIGPQHAVESWEMPAELMKRSFNGSPPAALSEQIQCACLRVPVEREQFLWSVFRNLPPDSGVQLVRAWLLHHDLEDISRVERAVTHVHTAKGEHAAALDIMRWAEVRELSVQRSDVERWKSLYFRMLRNTAEERASSTKRSGSLDVAALDMSTPMLEAADCSMQLTEYRSYRTQLTRLDVPLHNITQSEALILQQFLGEQLALTTDAARDESVCTRSQLDLAFRTLEELQLKTQVPITLQDDEWPTFASTLFLSEGWRHLCSRQQHDSQLHEKQLIVGDLQRLQTQMNAGGRAALGGNLVDCVGDPENSLQWLSELLAEHVQTQSDDPAFAQNTPPEQLADHLAFEIGQSTLWRLSFALLLPRECESYFAAPPAAQEPFKLAFMLAADRLVEKPQSDTCGKLLHTDPQAAHVMVQLVQLERASSSDPLPLTSSRPCSKAEEALLPHKCERYFAARGMVAAAEQQEAPGTAAAHAEAHAEERARSEQLQRKVRAAAVANKRAAERAEQRADKAASELLKECEEEEEEDRRKKEGAAAGGSKKKKKKEKEKEREAQAQRSSAATAAAAAAAAEAPEAAEAAAAPPEAEVREEEQQREQAEEQARTEAARRAREAAAAEEARLEAELRARRAAAEEAGQRRATTAVESRRAAAAEKSRLAAAAVMAAVASVSTGAGPGTRPAEARVAEGLITALECARDEITQLDSIVEQQQQEAALQAQDLLLAQELSRSHAAAALLAQEEHAVLKQQSQREKEREREALDHLQRESEMNQTRQDAERALDREAQAELKQQVQREREAFHAERDALRQQLHRSQFIRVTAALQSHLLNSDPNP